MNELELIKNGQDYIVFKIETGAKDNVTFMGLHSKEELDTMPVLSTRTNYIPELLRNLKSSLNELAFLMKPAIEGCNLEDIKGYALEEQDLVLGDLYFMDMFSFNTPLDIIKRLRVQSISDVMETIHKNENNIESYYLIAKVSSKVNMERKNRGHYEFIGGAQWQQ